MKFSPPRILIAALRGGSGKTILSLGIIAALKTDGLKIAPFKKGPDFIDAGWLGLAASATCHNLDAFMMTPEQILLSFHTHSKEAQVSVIEGNRGLYDGLDVDGCCSSAELAKLLQAPVIIVLDVSMATRTMAAMLKGCIQFDPDVFIAGTILNRVGGSRQEALVREAVEKYAETKVLGAIPRDKKDIFPERHMGLVPYQEREYADRAISSIEETVRRNVDLKGLLDIANEAGKSQLSIDHQYQRVDPSPATSQPRIGFIRDKSFWFYYPENLEMLESLGAILVEVSAISSGKMPSMDALYIGGGFPETQAKVLAENALFRDELKSEIEKGLPVYAECGGLMYLGKRLFVEGNYFPMVGALPVEFILHKKPRGHGYTVLRSIESNPFFPVGETIRGHEFHYSEALIENEEEIRFAFKVERGYGLDGVRDGICKKNLLGMYTHVHAAGYQAWANNFFQTAVRFKNRP